MQDSALACPRITVDEKFLYLLLGWWSDAIQHIIMATFAVRATAARTSDIEWGTVDEVQIGRRPQWQVIAPAGSLQGRGASAEVCPPRTAAPRPLRLPLPLPGAAALPAAAAYPASPAHSSHRPTLLI